MFFQGKYDAPWPSWGKVPKHIQDLWFVELKWLHLHTLCVPNSLLWYYLMSYCLLNCRSGSLRILSMRSESGESLKMEIMHMAKQGTTTSSLNGSVMLNGKGSNNIGQTKRTRNYVNNPKKIGLVIQRS